MHLIILFCLLQGFSEFLPISSQGHLIVFNYFLNFESLLNFSILEANILAHLGSLVAVCIYYHRNILSLIMSIKHLPRPDIDSNATFLINLFIASLPAILFGYFFANFFQYSSTLLILIIGLVSIIFGIVLFLVDRFCLRIKGINELNFFSSLVVGIAQCFAFIPGVSRSGAVLSMSRFLGFRRDFSVYFSNILSIPIILGASGYLIYNNQNIFFLEILNFQSFAIVIFSFLFSIFFIHFFVTWVRNSSLLLFVIYRLIFGSFLIFLFFFI